MDSDHGDHDQMGTFKPATVAWRGMPPSDVTGAFGMNGVYRSWQALTAAAVAGARASNHALLAPLQGAVAAMGADADPPTHRPPSIPSLDYERDDWTFDRTVDDVESIAVGDRVRFTKHITEDDVAAFAEVSGDTNRLHLDADYAERSRFGGRIVHGTLVAGLISAALARLPGLTIYLSQVVDFLAPVEPDTTVTAVVEIVEDLGDGQFRLSTTIQDEAGTQVIDGEAVVLVDEVDG